MIEATKLYELREQFEQFNKEKLQEAKIKYSVVEAKRRDFIEALKELNKQITTIDNEIAKEHSKYEAHAESLGIDRAEVISNLPITLTGGVTDPKTLATIRPGEYQ